MRDRSKQILAVFLFHALVTFSLFADQKPQGFAFGGKRILIGMSKADAINDLSECCTLSPPAETDIEKIPVRPGQILAHVIQPKINPDSRILGSISFRNGRVFRLTRPFAEDVDTYSDDVVGLVNALKHSLPIEATESEVVIRVSVRHENISNAKSDVMFLVFPDGREIQFHVGTLDKPVKEIGKRDYVSMDEVLTQIP